MYSLAALQVFLSYGHVPKMTYIKAPNNGNIPKTNIAYIEPHKLVINNITYLFFNECENVYINTLEKSITFNELENYIKIHKD